MAQRITKREDGSVVSTLLVKLVSSCKVLPQYVNLGYSRFMFRPYNCTRHPIHLVHVGHFSCSCI